MTDEATRVEAPEVPASAPAPAPAPEASANSPAPAPVAPAAQEAPSAESEELLAGKYKTKEDLVEGYLNLQKKIGNFAGAPEDYSLDNINKEADLKFIADDPHLNSFKKLAKDSNMSQEMFDGILNLYRDYVKQGIPDPKAEVAKLGENADVRVRNMNTWADKHLSDEGKARMKKYVGENVNEADLFLLLDEIRNASRPAEGPQNFAPNMMSGRSVDSIKQEIIDNYDKYSTQISYQRDLRAQLEAALAASKK
jgi:hypothetical protein